MIIDMDLDSKDTWAFFNAIFFQKNGEEAQLLVNVADKERYNNHPAGSTQQYPAVEHDILRNRTNSVYGDVRFLILNVLLNNNFSDIQQHNMT